MPEPVFEPLAGKITDHPRDELRKTLEERGIILPEREKAARVMLVGFSETDAGVTLCERLALSCPEKILAGATVAMYIYGVRSCRLCVPKNLYNAANELYSSARGKKQFSVTVISDKYPLCDPRLLISAVCGSEINPLKPLERTGYAVLTPETCVLICDALVYGYPAGKYFSVEGAVRSLVRCAPGTPLCELVEIPDGMTVTEGGAIRGREVPKDVPAGDGDGYLIGRKYMGPREKLPLPCDRCGLCDLACPVRLRPSEFMKKAGRLPDGSACIGCRACDAVCPSGVKLCDTVRASARNREDGHEGAEKNA